MVTQIQIYNTNTNKQHKYKLGTQIQIGNTNTTIATQIQQGETITTWRQKSKLVKQKQIG